MSTSTETASKATPKDSTEANAETNPSGAPVAKAERRRTLFASSYPLILLIALAIAGATFQAVFRNPLVSPYLLGVSQGASVGAASAILLGVGTSIAIQGSALAGAPKLAVTTNYVTTIPWFRQVYPDITKVPAPVAANNDLNMEALLATEPDVVLVSNKKQAEAVRQAGLTAVRVGFSDMNGLMQTVNLTAEVLGTQGAYERAQKYNAYMQKNLKLIEERLKDLPDSERPKVMHIGSGTKVQNVSGSGIVIDEWIKIAGGRNVAADQKGMKDVSMEQITAYAPEVIIIGGDASAKGVQTIKSDAAWKDVPAVKNDKVIRNPYGTFNWDRYSTEGALQVLWAGKTLHPELFTDIDLVKETQEFYSTFYGYNLTEDEAQRIINGEAPAAS